jgi:hypothetical protein
MLRTWLQKLSAAGTPAGPRRFRPEVEALEVRYTHHRSYTIAEYNPYTGQTLVNNYTDHGTWTGWLPAQQYLIDGGYQRLGTYDPYTDTGSWNLYDAGGNLAGSWGSYWTGSGVDDSFWSSLGY